MKIGVDIGGTKISGGLVDARGRVVRRFRTATNARRGRAAMIRSIQATVEALLMSRVAGIGVGIAGSVDLKRGMYLHGTHLGSFRNIPLVRILKNKFHVPVAIENDANCFTLAEARVGSGKGERFVIGMTVGTGIGGGIVLDGKLYDGIHNKAGNFGHMTIGLDASVRCACGGQNHLEAIAGGKGMAVRYAQETGQQVDAIEIEKRAASNDRAARRIMDQAAEALGTGIANVVTALDPSVLIIGGGLSRYKDYMQGSMREARRFLLCSKFLRQTPIVLSELGDDAQIIGAAMLV